MATAQKLSTIINGVNVDNLFATVDAVKTAPAAANFKFSIENQWEVGSHNYSIVDEFYGAGRQHSRSQAFVLRSDEPAVLLGDDSAANPVEYLLHALAACITTSMVYHASARGIRIHAVECSLEGDIDLQGFLALDPKVRNGYQGIRVSFRLQADAPDDQLQDIVALGTSRSPVFDSITHGVPVTVTAERL